MNINRTDKAINYYLYNPILCDVLLIALLLGIEVICKKILVHYGMPLLTVLNNSSAGDYTGSLISTIVSLSGFLVAALTIMITVKASLKARGFNDAGNALEYLFTTDRYFEIVQVFTTAIAELIVLLVCSYIVWLSASNISLVPLSKILFGITFATSAAIIRSIFIFFKILKLEKSKAPQKVVESNDDKQTRLLQQILEQLSKK
jgi:hypothetical protein